MEDSFRIERLEMVEKQIRRRGIQDPDVLAAFRKVPRHEFVPTSQRAEAYCDCPLPIGEGQTISQPYMVASMTEKARIKPGMRVLEIGTGSGYQSAILCALKAEVFTIERIQALSERAEKILNRLGCVSIHYRVGDGSEGWPEEAQFGAIIVTAGAPDIPKPLVEQLEVGGRLVIPVENRYSQILSIVTRTADGFKEEHTERCTFVPLLGRYGWDH